MEMKKFKDNQSGYHRSAVDILAEWVNGITEMPFIIDSEIVFVPDVTCKENDVITRLYEVVHSHYVTGRKLGMMQYWCYFNNTELSVFEVSSDFILGQTGKPDWIEAMEYYKIGEEI
jgi:hypothetical protein